MSLAGMKYVPDMVGIEAARKEWSIGPAFAALADDLAQRIRSLIPIASVDEHLGTSSEKASEDLAKSVHVEIVEDHFCVTSRDFRAHFIEFGFVHLGGIQEPAHAPFRRATEAWAAERGWIVVPVNTGALHTPGH